MNIHDQLEAIDPSETQVRSKGHGLTTRQAHVRRADVGALGRPRHRWRRAQGRLRRACGGGGRFTGHGTTPWETAWARTAMGDWFIDLSDKVFRGKVDSSCLTGMTKVSIYVYIVPTLFYRTEIIRNPLNIWPPGSGDLCSGDEGGMAPNFSGSRG